MPYGRRLELLGWAKSAPDRYIIEDDYDSEFRYKGKPLPSMQASDAGGRVVYIGTFSKSIAPAIRISYMVLPYTLLERYHRECGFYASSVLQPDSPQLPARLQALEEIDDGGRGEGLQHARHDVRMQDFTSCLGTAGEEQKRNWREGRCRQESEPTGWEASASEQKKKTPESLL